MKILLAEPHGFCTGVRRAIEIAEKGLAETDGCLYCLNKLVHNESVVGDLASRGMVFVKDVSEVPEGETLLFSAHGVAPSVREAAAKRNLRVIDATCVFVARIHDAVRRFSADGYTVFLVGQKKHDEVVGVMGEGAGNVIVVETPEDAAAVSPADPEKVAVVTQTTLTADNVEAVVSVLAGRFPKLVRPDHSGICYATTERQNAVREVAAKSDVVLVLGSKGSANTNRLVDVAHSAGARAILVPDIETLKALVADGEFNGVETIGITSGASTPEDFVHAAVKILAR